MPSWPVGNWMEREAADDSWADDLADDERYREIFGGITEEVDGTASVRNIPRDSTNPRGGRMDRRN